MITALTSDGRHQILERKDPRNQLPQELKWKRVRVVEDGEPVTRIEFQQRLSIKDWVEKYFLTNTTYSITLNFEYGVEIDAARKVVSIFMNELDKHLLRSRDVDKHPDRRCRWVALPEGQQHGKRLHFHIQVESQPEFSDDDLESAVRSTFRKISTKRKFGLATDFTGMVWNRATDSGYHGYVAKEIMENERSIEHIVFSGEKVSYLPC